MQPTNPNDRIADLRGLLADLVAESRNVNAGLRAETRARKLKGLATLALAAAATLLAALTFATAQQNGNIARETRATNDRILDCTTVGGQCYEEARQRSTSLVQQIVRANITVHDCLHDDPDVTTAELEACVNRKLTPQ